VGPGRTSSFRRGTGSCPHVSLTPRRRNRAPPPRAYQGGGTRAEPYGICCIHSPAPHAHTHYLGEPCSQPKATEALPDRCPLEVSHAGGRTDMGRRIVCFVGRESHQLGLAAIYSAHERVSARRVVLVRRALLVHKLATRATFVEEAVPRWERTFLKGAHGRGRVLRGGVCRRDMLIHVSTSKCRVANAQTRLNFVVTGNSDRRGARGACLAGAFLAAITRCG